MNEHGLLGKHQNIFDYGDSLIKDGVGKMETFGRGCLYIIVGIVILMLLALLTQSQITISIFIVIPLIIIAFWIAKKKTDKKK